MGFGLGICTFLGVIFFLSLRRAAVVIIAKIWSPFAIVTILVFVVFIDTPLARQRLVGLGEGGVLQFLY